MDKRLVFIILGSLAICYLVGRKACPELLQSWQDRIVAAATGKPSPDALAEKAKADAWEKHRQTALAARVAESKQRAIEKYPALAIANSEMNIRFVYRYKWMSQENNPRLQTANWPEVLADECAAAAAAQAAKPVGGKKSFVPKPMVASGTAKLADR